MASNEENELLNRVGPGTPMGTLFRQYQIPLLISSELSAGGSPKRVRLLGEDLVAFRTQSGRVGLVGEACQHRCASLYFGRIEEDGIRCIYHGWKYGFEGQCLEMPNVPPEFQFKERISHISYPCVEKGGLIWAYMGDSDQSPPVPELEFLMVPEEHRSFDNRDYHECSYLQALEGGIDPSHAAFLHGPIQSIALADELANRPHGTGLSGDSHLSTAFRDAFTTGERTPVVETVETEYGVMMAGRRNLDADKYIWRINHFFFPFYTMAPGDPREAFLAHMWVPVDDENHVNWLPRWNPYRPFTEQEREHFRSNHLSPSAEAWGHIRRVADKRNNYFMDWEIHRTRKFGIPSVHLQDVAITESQGAICDRTKEHLTQADAPIVAVRERLMEAAKALRDRGAPPPGAHQPTCYRGIRGLSVVMPKGVDWVEGLKDHMSVAIKQDGAAHGPTG